MDLCSIGISLFPAVEINVDVRYNKNKQGNRVLRRHANTPDGYETACLAEEIPLTAKLAGISFLIYSTITSRHATLI
jgi:hypothetical protein